MKYCPNCHVTYGDEAHTCVQCGGALQALSPQQVQQLQQMQQQQLRQQPQMQQMPPQYQGAPMMMAAPVDPADHTAEFDPKDISDNKVFAMLPYLLSFVGVVISLLAAQSSDYTMFHVRQGLKLQICSMLLVIAAIVPILGWIVMGIGQIVLVVVQIICFFRVCSGKAQEPPIVKNLGFLK